MCNQVVLKLMRKAIKSNYVDVVQAMVLKYPKIIKLPIWRDSYGEYTPLWLAAKIGQERIVEVLIELGADPDQRTKIKRKGKYYEWTLLHYLPFMNDKATNEKIARILIRHGADVNNAWNHVHMTPLQIAMHLGFVDYCEFLLKNGAGLRAPYWISGNPMQYVFAAPVAKQKEILKLIVQHSFNTRSIIYYDKEYTINYIQWTLSKALKKPRTVDVVGITKILLDSGVPVNHFDERGQSALVMAIALENPDLILLLLRRGAKVDVKVRMKCGFEDSLLSVAVQTNNEVIINLLLMHGVDFNSKNKKGWTALHSACAHRQLTSLRFLIKKGALLNVEDQEGRTPFYYLNPLDFYQPDIPCIIEMIKEIAKNFFYGDAVSEKDIDLICSHPHLGSLFENCKLELLQLSSLKFYKCYTYVCVRKMSIGNMRKLAKLTKNEEFVSSFYEKLAGFHFYKDEYETILEEAIRMKNEMLTVDFRLKYIFGDTLPDVVLSVLADNLTLKDLPFQILQPLDTWK